jgi:nitrous oxide reductase
MGRIKETRNMYIIFVEKSYKLTITPRRRGAMTYAAVRTSVSFCYCHWF